jgi:hypothetical protein
LVEAFFEPRRKERYLELLWNPKRRTDVTREFAHFKHLDHPWIQPIPPNRQNLRRIVSILKSKAAPEHCHVLSEDPELDGQSMELTAALEQILGLGIGTFLSCIPGRLAYFEDEDGRCILERSNAERVRRAKR